jgi:hypothetical protein
MINIFFFENRDVYETMLRIFVEPGRSQMRVWRMRIAGWVPKARNARSQNIILLLLHYNSGWTESSWMLCYKHIFCLGIGYEGMDLWNCKHISSFIIQHSIRLTHYNTNCAFTNFRRLSHLSCTSNRRVSFCKEIPSVSSYGACS